MIVIIWLYFQTQPKLLSGVFILKQKFKITVTNNFDLFKNKNKKEFLTYI